MGLGQTARESCGRSTVHERSVRRARSRPVPRSLFAARFVRLRGAADAGADPFQPTGRVGPALHLFRFLHFGALKSRTPIPIFYQLPMPAATIDQALPDVAAN